MVAWLWRSYGLPVVRWTAIFYYTKAVEQIHPLHPDSHYVSRRLDHWKGLKV